MLNRLIMSAGAISLAVGLGCCAFVLGCRITGRGVPVGANGIGTGLLFSIAIGVWGIFALLLHRKSERT